MANIFSGPYEAGGGSTDIDTSNFPNHSFNSLTFDNPTTDTRDPRGGYNAAQLECDDTDTAQRRYSGSYTVTASVTYYYSCFAKWDGTAGLPGLHLAAQGGVDTWYGKRFNLIDGTVYTGFFLNEPAGSGIVNYGNGWYRCWISVANGSDTYQTFSIGIGGNGTETLTGVVGAGPYVYGVYADTTDYTDWVEDATPFAQWDVNTRGRTDGVPYDYINSSAGTNTGAPITEIGEGYRTGLVYPGGTSPEVYSALNYPSLLSADFADSDFTMAVRCKLTAAQGATMAAFAAGSTTNVGENVLVGVVTGSPIDLGYAGVRDGGSPLQTANITGDTVVTGSEGVLTLRRETTGSPLTPVLTLFWNGTSIGSDTDVSNIAGYTLDLLSWGVLRRGATGSPQTPLLANHAAATVYWSAIWTRALSTAEIQELDDVPNPFDVSTGNAIPAIMPYLTLLSGTS